MWPRIQTTIPLPMATVWVILLSYGINDCISSPTTGTRSKKVLMLHLFPGVGSRWYHHIKGEEVTRHRILPWAITDLWGIKSFEDLNKTDMVFSSSKVEDLKAAERTLLKVTSWIDWWFYAAKSLAMQDIRRAKVELFFVAGARTILLVAKTASTIWENTLLKCCDALLGKMKGNISLNPSWNFAKLLYKLEWAVPMWCLRENGR